MCAGNMGLGLGHLSSGRESPDEDPPGTGAKRFFSAVTPLVVPLLTHTYNASIGSTWQQLLHRNRTYFSANASGSTVPFREICDLMEEISNPISMPNLIFWDTLIQPLVSMVVHPHYRLVCKKKKSRTFAQPPPAISLGYEYLSGISTW